MKQQRWVQRKRVYQMAGRSNWRSWATGGVIVAALLLTAAWGGAQTLPEAAQRGDLAALRQLAGGGANIDETDRDGRTATHWAAARGQLEALQYLLEQGARLDLGDAKGDTPLHAAAAAGQVDSLSLLVQRGAAVDPTSKVGRTPLHEAALAGQAAAAAALLDLGAQHLISDDEANSPLHLAARAGHGEVIAAVVSRGGKVVMANADGDTALHLAVKAGQLEAARRLVSLGAPLEAPNLDDLTPLDLAADKPEMLTVLQTTPVDLPALADEELEPEGEQADEAEAVLTPPMGDSTAPATAPPLVAVRPTVAPAFTQAGSGATGPRPATGRPPATSPPPSPSVPPLPPGARPPATGPVGQLEADLSLVASYGFTTRVRELIARGANPRAYNEVGDTPLHRAVYHGHLETVRALVEHGAEVNARDRFGYTPLQWAVRQGQTAMTAYLLSAGAEAGAADPYGMTPLHWAAREGYRGVAAELLQRGADSQLADGAKLTPLGWAVYNHRAEVARVLRLDPREIAADRLRGNEAAILSTSGGRALATRSLLLGRSGNPANDRGNPCRPVTLVAEHPDQGHGFGQLTVPRGQTVRLTGRLTADLTALEGQPLFPVYDRVLVQLLDPDNNEIGRVEGPVGRSAAGQTHEGPTASYDLTSTSPRGTYTIRAYRLIRAGNSNMWDRLADLKVDAGG